MTAAKMVAELALGQGKYFQAFPEYGPERSGAPIVAFTRVSDEPIQIYSRHRAPADRGRARPVAAERSSTSPRARPTTPSCWSTARCSPAELRKHYGLEGRPPLHHRRHPHRRRDHQAAHPQHAHGRRAHAHHRAVPHREVVEFLRDDFGKKFPPKVVEGNIAAITRSYEEVQGE